MAAALARTAAALLLLGAALLPCAACSGYRTERLTDFPRARTVAVVPFENTGFRRDLELRLSQLVAQEIRARTSLAAATTASADLLITGRMGADETPIALDEDGRVVQRRVEGFLEVRVIERATGRVVRQARLRAIEEVRPGYQGESVEGSGSDAMLRDLAERVVQLLERPF